MKVGISSFESNDFSTTNQDQTHLLWISKNIDTGFKSNI